MSPHLGHHRSRLRGGLRTARRKRIGLPALSNGDLEACRCRVGARIGSGAVDAVATDAEPGARAWQTLDGARAVNSISGSHGVFHPQPLRVTGRNDCSRLRANERRPDHVELETGHRQRALPCLGPIRYMAQRAVTRVDRTLERASARRFRIDPRTARDRERLRLRGYGHEGYASFLGRHNVDRSLPDDLESDRGRESLTEAAFASTRPQIHLEVVRSAHVAQSAERAAYVTRMAVCCDPGRLAEAVPLEMQRRIHLEGSAPGRRPPNRVPPKAGQACEPARRRRQGPWQAKTQ